MQRQMIRRSQSYCQPLPGSIAPPTTKSELRRVALSTPHHRMAPSRQATVCTRHSSGHVTWPKTTPKTSLTPWPGRRA